MPERRPAPEARYPRMLRFWAPCPPLQPAAAPPLPASPPPANPCRTGARWVPPPPAGRRWNWGGGGPGEPAPSGRRPAVTFTGRARSLRTGGTPMVKGVPGGVGARCPPPPPHPAFSALFWGDFPPPTSRKVGDFGDRGAGGRGRCAPAALQNGAWRSRAASPPPGLSVALMNPAPSASVPLAGRSCCILGELEHGSCSSHRQAALGNKAPRSCAKCPRAAGEGFGENASMMGFDTAFYL